MAFTSISTIAIIATVDTLFLYSDIAIISTRGNFQIDDYYISVGVIITSTGWDERPDYESLQHQLNLNLETVRLTEDEMDADPEETSAVIDNTPFSAPTEEQG